MSPNEVTSRPNSKLMEKLKRNITGPGTEDYDEVEVKRLKLTTDMNYKHEYIMSLVIIFAILHAAALYGLYFIVSFRIKLLSFLWGCFLGLASAEGIVLGSHRGFSHNSFKLNTFGQVVVIILQTVSGQNNIYWWVRDHRLHHKFVDTDADPYNAKRGFFFSHIGWLITRKHPLVKEKGSTIDMSDIQANKLIMFQKKYYYPLFFLFNIIIPVAVPIYGWNEDVWVAFFTVFAYRYVHVLNSTWCINSIAHMYGTKSFDARVSATQSRFGDIATFGDGWHNYHHAFPWDWTMSEFGYYGGMSTIILNWLKNIGVAYDFKKASRELVYNHTKRYGDGTLTEKDFEREYVKSSIQT